MVTDTSLSVWLASLRCFSESVLTCDDLSPCIVTPSLCWPVMTCLPALLLRVCADLWWLASLHYFSESVLTCNDLPPCVPHNITPTVGWSLFLKLWISSFSPLYCLLLYQLTMHTKYFWISTMFRGSSMSFKCDLTYLGSDACVWWHNTFLYTFRTLSTYLVHRWRYCQHAAILISADSKL